MKPRIMLVSRNLPPLLGGMERLNARIVWALSSQFDTVVSGPSGSRPFLTDATAVAEAPLRPLPGFLLVSLLNAFRLAFAYRPSLVIAGSGLTAPMAHFAARLLGVPSVVYLHGLDIVAPSRLYQALWLPVIRRADLLICNSTSTARLAVEHGANASRIHIVRPGTNLPAELPGAGEGFRSRHGLGDGPLLLSVGRLTPRKGLADFVAKTMPALLHHIPNARLIIIGADAANALHGGANEREKIESFARKAGVLEALHFLPPCDDSELSAAYWGADVHVFPVKAIPGDVEGFGMVAIEAAAHGLPTVAFDVGGVADAIVVGKTGVLVAADDYTAMAEALIGLLSQRGDVQVARDECKAAASRFGWDRFREELLSISNVHRGME